MPQMIVPAIMLTSGAIGAASSIRQGNQMKAAENANAEVALQSAELTKRQGEFDIIAKRKEARNLESKQKQMYAMAGVQLSGSPLQTMADSASEYALDEMMMQYNTQMGVSRAESEARYKKYLGKQYAQQGYMNAFNTLLSTGTSMYTGGKTKLGG